MRQIVRCQVITGAHVCTQLSFHGADELRGADSDELEDLKHVLNDIAPTVSMCDSAVTKIRKFYGQIPSLRVLVMRLEHLGMDSKIASKCVIT